MVDFQTGDQSGDDAEDLPPVKDTDEQPAAKKSKRKKRAVGYVYVSTDDEEADTLKDKFWRLTSKSGGKKPPALIAVAHNILNLVYQVLSTGQPYQERGAPPLQENQRQRMIRHHFHRLGKLGIAIPRYVADSFEPKSKTCMPRTQ